MINFTRAFDSAWERMAVILFQPFDLAKWFTIGLSAFLAGLLSGGNGFNASYNRNNGFGKADLQTPNFQALHSGISNALAGVQIGIIIMVAIIILFFALALTVLIYWLGARGQFLFLDNIVRNRGAIRWPWSYYARHANSLFLFYLLVMVVSLFIVLPMIGIGIVMALPFYHQNRWPHGWEIGGFILLGAVYLIFAAVLNFILFVFKEFGVPLMFRNGLLAGAAFMESLGLIQRHFGSVL
ncbi:MAG TPA: hypothetical protein VL981_10805, partial [Candidatus Methylacidiphilales bacterium]|nr:hypothetical protein [Candidatus Methylacidiphilales bacterium]